MKIQLSHLSPEDLGFIYDQLCPQWATKKVSIRNEAGLIRAEDEYKKRIFFRLMQKTQGRISRFDPKVQSYLETRYSQKITEILSNKRFSIN